MVEIIGMCATLGGAVWTYYKTKDQQKATLVTVVVLLGVCCTLLLSFRLEVIPGIEARQQVSEQLLKNPKAYELAATRAVHDCIKKGLNQKVFDFGV